MRLIAATNRDLAEELQRPLPRRFLPPFECVPTARLFRASAGGDVLLLAGFFLEQNRSRMGLGSLRSTSDAQAALLAYNWPGNVRELEHLIGRSAPRQLSRASEDASLSAQDLDLARASARPRSKRQPMPPSSAATCARPPSTTSVKSSTPAPERHQHNWASAARELGLTAPPANGL